MLVSTAIAATPTACCTHTGAPGATYAATVNAMAAHETILPITNPHPARKPRNGPRCSHP